MSENTEGIASKIVAKPDTSRVKGYILAAIISELQILMLINFARALSSRAYVRVSGLYLENKLFL
jgi:hypothetical protein